MLSSTTSAAVISHTKSIFGRYGIPHIVRANNGPQFASSEFCRIFQEVRWFVRRTSNPYFPRSYGMAENRVKTVKRLPKKVIALLSYRAASLENGKSSAEMLYGGRKIATRLKMVTQKSCLPNSKWEQRYKEENQSKEGHYRRVILIGKLILFPEVVPWSYRVSAGGTVSRS